MPVMRDLIPDSGCYGVIQGQIGSRFRVNLLPEYTRMISSGYGDHCVLSASCLLVVRQPGLQWISQAFVVATRSTTPSKITLGWSY